jgi:hypothetical protein
MLVALGAILAFAVKGHPWFLNIQIVGWVIMLTGVAGMVLPRRGYGWLRRRMVLRRGPSGRPVVGRVEETQYPPYVMLNRGSTAGTTVVADAEKDTTTTELPTAVDPPGEQATARHPDAERRAAERAETEFAAAERAVAEWEAAEAAASASGGARPAEEVVEEYVEE